jgi:hypothetical protein
MRSKLQAVSNVLHTARLESQLTLTKVQIAEYGDGQFAVVELYTRTVCNVPRRLNSSSLGQRECSYCRTEENHQDSILHDDRKVSVYESRSCWMAAVEQSARA